MTEDLIQPKKFIELFHVLEDDIINFEKPKKYNVPVYQRTYKWDDDLCEMFFHDMTSSLGNQYNFGLITVAINNKEKQIYDIVDGQQRLISFYLLTLAICFNAYKYNDKKENYLAIHNFVNSDLPFLAESITRGYLDDLRIKVLNKENIVNDDSSNQVILNFLSFVEFLNKILSKIDNDNQKIVKLRKLFDLISRQDIFLLKYFTKQNALQSFISLNMKSKELDSFEICSALLLSRMDNSVDESEYRQKLNLVYNNYSKLTSFSSFEYLLTQLIWGQYSEYKKYCLDVNLISEEIKVTMPNHYVDKKIVLPVHAKNFINQMVFVTEKLHLLLKNGDIEWVLNSLVDDNSDIYKRIVLRISEIKYSIFSYKAGKSSIRFITINERFLISIFYIFENHIKAETLTYEITDNLLREILLVTLEQHILNITGTSDIIRRKHKNTYSSHSINKFREEWAVEGDLGKQSISHKVKISGIRKEYDLISLSKVDSLRVFYQIISSQKNLPISDKIEIFNLPSDPINREHLFIDNSYAKNLPLKDSAFFNTFYIPKVINDSFAFDNYKTLYKKIRYVIRQKETLGRKYYFFYRLCIISKRILSKKLKKVSPDDFEILKKIYFGKGIIIDSSNRNIFLKFHNDFLSLITKEIVSEFYSKLENFIYDNKNIINL